MERLSSDTKPYLAAVTHDTCPFHLRRSRAMLRASRPRQAHIETPTCHCEPTPRVISAERHARKSQVSLEGAERPGRRMLHLLLIKAEPPSAVMGSSDERKQEFVSPSPCSGPRHTSGQLHGSHDCDLVPLLSSLEYVHYYPGILQKRKPPRRGPYLIRP